MTLDEFIATYKLEMRSQRVPQNPNMTADAQWSRTASHWFCNIKSRRANHHNQPHEDLDVYYSMGSAHKGAPKLRDVLDSLAGEAYADSVSFEDWASEFGFDEDSRTAERTYNACKKIASGLRKLLGYGGFNDLLNKVERL